MTPQELNHILNGMVETVVAYLLPNGSKNGRSWCSGSVDGESGQSLRVCLEGQKVGLWSDFNGNANGGDLLSLWQQCRKLSFVETLKEAKEFAGVVDDDYKMFTPAKKKKKQVIKPKCQKPTEQVAKWFESRGIFKESLDSYKVGAQGSVIVFPFLSPEGELELVKYRDISSEIDGKKKIWSNEDPDYHLWGWHGIGNNEKDVVITEGEIDCLSYCQQCIAALSIPQGAGDGVKQTVWIENDYERLQRFETIYVSMDMDAPGQSSIKTIIERLGIERCRIVDLGGFKDANEAHMAGVDLLDYLKKAKTRDPEELSKLIDHHKSIMSEFENSGSIGTRLPWSKTHDTIRLRPSEITLWAGVNSHGKSLAVSHVTVDAVSQGERVCIASMEMKPRKLGRKLYQQVAGKSHPDKKDEEGIVEFLGDKVWLFEVYGTAKAGRIIEVFTYARKRYGITHFIVDSLAKCGFGEDDYNGQKSFVDNLMEFSGKHDVHVHLVSHMRKREDESKILGKMDIKGTGAITDMVDNVFIWWRNKAKERDESASKRDEPDAILNCEKQRETGVEPFVGLFFHSDSCQFTERQNDPPKQYLF